MPSSDCIDKSLNENTEEDKITPASIEAQYEKIGENQAENENTEEDMTSSSYIDESLNNLDQENPILIEAIRKMMIKSSKFLIKLTQSKSKRTITTSVQGKFNGIVIVIVNHFKVSNHIICLTKGLVYALKRDEKIISQFLSD